MNQQNLFENTYSLTENFEKFESYFSSFKYHFVEGANTLYQEMITLELVPDLRTIHELIRLIPFIDAKVDVKIEQLMLKLKDLKRLEIQPNLFTFNACLQVISTFGLNQKCIPLALNILKEMELMGYQPCLATWSHVLAIFYPAKDIGTKTEVLKQVWFICYEKYQVKSNI